MSLPQRLYNLGCLISKCELVRTKLPTDDNRAELQRLLNESSPLNEAEQAQRDLVRGMYYSTQTEFTSYVNQPKNRVRALIYWTESKQIARALGLLGKVHIKWAADVGYTVDVFVPRSQREQPTTTTPAPVRPDVRVRNRVIMTKAKTAPVVRDDPVMSVDEYLARESANAVASTDVPVVVSVTALPGMTYSEAVKWCDATD